MSVTRREFLSKTSAICVGALLPFTHNKAKPDKRIFYATKPVVLSDELPRVSGQDVLNTVFTRVDILPNIAAEFPLDFFRNSNSIAYALFDKDGKYLEKHDGEAAIIVPMLPISNYATINQQAFQLLVYAAIDSGKPVLNPTHEIITEVGVVQLDLRRKDSFVFPTRRSAHTNEYGLAVLDPSKIGMQQQ